MSRKWVSCIYAFFKPTPTIEHMEGRKCHTFKCAAKSCTHSIQHYVDGKDTQSMGNMFQHAKKCWGDDAVCTADQARDVTEARSKIVNGIL